MEVKLILFIKNYIVLTKILFLEHGVEEENTRRLKYRHKEMDKHKHTKEQVDSLSVCAICASLQLLKTMGLKKFNT